MGRGKGSREMRRGLVAWKADMGRKQDHKAVGEDPPELKFEKDG